MQRKTALYSDLSLSWSYLPKPNIIIHAACSNVLGRDNIFGYRYPPGLMKLKTAYKHAPVAQGAKRFAFIGLFIRFRVTKRMPTIKQSLNNQSPGT